MTLSPGLPDGPLLSFYGDDSTGASAVLEVCTFAGLPTVMFLNPPDAADLARFAHCRVIGIAGTARARDPAWMVTHLPPIFHALAGIKAPIALYKTCSTFDSSPDIGSIGQAIDLAVPILGGAWHPLLVAAPALGRYQIFGNLFAAADRQIYRLDRHPTMSRHPITPMHEADLARHLAQQTARRIGLVNLLALRDGSADAALHTARQAGADIISIDVLDDATLQAAGGLIWRHRGKKLLAVGSQGVAYALVAHFRAVGLLAAPRPVPPARPVARIAAVSASCAPVTAKQIAQAEQDGFATLRLDTTRAVDAAAWDYELDRAAAAGVAAAGTGRSVLAFTARGPGDPAIAATNAAITASGVSAGAVNLRIGTGLGALLARVMREAKISRGVIAGGDTSGHAAQALGIHALTALAPIAPGAPLCLAHGRRADSSLREFVFKGGQMGGEKFFHDVRQGGVTTDIDWRTGT
jgi:uncharacterized protein YgbK (DUF1537 family)